MVLFLFNEAVFFALLILAFVYYHELRQHRPNAANSLDRSHGHLHRLPARQQRHDLVADKSLRARQPVTA